MMIQENNYKNILSRLDDVNKKNVLYSAAEGFIKSISIGIILFVLFCIIEFLFKTSSHTRTIFVVIILSGLLLSIGLFVIYPAFKLLFKKSYHSLALKVGFHFPDVKDNLLNMLQLAETNNNFYSVPLLNAAFNSSYEETKALNFTNVVSSKKVKRASIFLLTTILTAIFILIIPGISSAADRIMKFNQEFIPPQRFYFIVEPGNAVYTKGTNLTIIIKTDGETPDYINLAIKEFDQPDYKMIELNSDSLNQFTYEIEGVQKSFKYYATSEEIKSNEYNIDAIDYPEIKYLNLDIAPPEYAGQKIYSQKDNGNVTGLRGTRINFNLNTTRKLKEAYIEYSDSTVAKLKTTADAASGSITLTKDIDYKIFVVDEMGNKNLMPVTYNLKTMNDAFPFIELIEPKENVELGIDNRVNNFLRISDDFGFSKLILHYVVSNNKDKTVREEKSVHVPITKNGNESEVNYVWNLTSLAVGNDENVNYYFEIFDNDYVAGYKSAKSNSVNIRVPSLEEVLNNADKVQNKAEESLKEIYKEADELKKTFEKIDQELKQEKRDLTWQEKEKIQKAVDKFENLQQKVEDAKEDLKKMQENLAENNLLSPETMQKYSELQKLFDELTSDEFKKAMEQMQNMLQQMNRQMAQNEMQNIKADEERFRKSIERTINLLKRIQVEQKIDELVKRSNDISSKEQSFNEEMQNKNLNNQQDKNEALKDQENISKDIQNFEEEMKELSEKMNTLEDMPKEEMEKLMQEFEQQQNEELSQDAENQIQQGNKQQASKQQQQISKNMQKMQQGMKQMQQQMEQKNQMETMRSMVKTLDDLITLSKKQEELKKETQRNAPNGAEKQQGIQSSLNKIINQLNELSKKTFAVSPEMGKYLGDARKNMSEAQQALQNRNNSFAESNQGEAMKSLNEAANQLKSSMEGMMQGGGQGGMMSLMQQLQKMTGQQMNLNNMTQQLQQGQGQMSPQQQAEMQRLAQQQQMIQKSLEQLNKEAKESGQSKKIPENLDNVSKEMQEVIQEMQAQKLNDELLQKQEKILSKLLDAQRSMNERDYEKDRESNTGTNISKKSPGPLNLNKNQDRDRIKEEINNTVQEGYKKDYENIIINYFQLLQQQKQ